MNRLGFALSVYFYFMTQQAFAGTVTIGTPGGPAPALKECVAEFNKSQKETKIEVVSGPIEKWQDQAASFELLFSGWKI